MNQKTSEIIEKMAPIILEEVKKANKILLHCHPSPDPDSVGSALAMRFALEQLGKKVTVIKGDSDLSKGFMHFPGAKDIVLKNFSEIDPTKYDLFIVLDSSTLDRISGLVDVSSFGEIKLINIDHHVSNTGFGYINMIVSDYPATAQILYDLFLKWGIEINDNIATNLFIGIYTDTGGLKYRNVSRRTYDIMADLVTKAKNF